MIRETGLSGFTITLNNAVEKLLEIPPRIADIAELIRLHELQKKHI